MSNTQNNELEAVTTEWHNARATIAQAAESGKSPSDEELERYWAARDEAERNGLI